MATTINFGRYSDRLNEAIFTLIGRNNENGLRRDFSFSDQGLLEVFDDLPIPTKEEFQAEEQRQSELYDYYKYARQRSREYRKLNQMELMYDDMRNGTNKWQEAVEAIKAKYPKPSGPAPE